MTSRHKERGLVVALGDQLDDQTAAFDGIDKSQDLVLQMEPATTRRTPTRPVPRFFRTDETDMHCLQEAIRHTINHAYAHYVLGAVLLGVRPYDVYRRHISMFRGCDRLGVAAERAGHEPACRRRRDRHQALRRIRQLHQPDERSLLPLPLQAEQGRWRGCLPVHHPVLGFPGAPHKSLPAQSAHGILVSQSGQEGPARNQRDPPPGRYPEIQADSGDIPVNQCRASVRLADHPLPSNAGCCHGLLIQCVTF